MGNDQTMGVAILNNTNFKITCGASMGATQKYGNDIMPGEIWYRHTGAVWVTLFAMPTTEKTRYSDGRCPVEIIKETVVITFATAVTLASLGALAPLFGPYAGFSAVLAVGGGGGCAAIAGALGLTVA